MVYSRLTQISRTLEKGSVGSCKPADQFLSRARQQAVFALFLTVALATVSCTHHLQTASPPAVTTVMTRQARNAVELGDGDLEAQQLRKRLAADARDLDARVLLARVYARRGLPDLALEHYRLAAVQFPDSPAVALALAKTLREMGESEGALKAIADSTVQTWELLSLKGIILDEQGRFALAEPVHRAALAVDPNRSGLRTNLGYNLLLQGQGEAAAAELRRALEIDPHSAVAHNNLAMALVLQAHPLPAQALAEWQRTLDPAEAHNNLAAVLIEQGRFEEARAELNLALASRRNFPAAMSNLELVAQRDGRPATVPAVAEPVNLWKHLTSTWAKLIGNRSAPKPQESAGAGDVPVDAKQASSLKTDAGTN